jgi:hypothetical protein
MDWLGSLMQGWAAAHPTATISAAACVVGLSVCVAHAAVTGPALGVVGFGGGGVGAGTFCWVLIAMHQINKAISDPTRC